MRRPVRTSVVLPSPAREAILTLRIKRHRQHGFRPTMGRILREGLWDLLVREGIVDPLSSTLEDWEDERTGADRFKPSRLTREAASGRR